MKGIGRTVFKKYGKIINFVSDIIGILPVNCRKRGLVFFRNIKGNFGILLRYLLLKSLARRCGENVSIYENVYLYNPENLLVGDNVSVHPMCYIQPGRGNISIGNNVSIAHGVTLIAESHQYGDVDTPIKYQPMKNGIIEIDDNVWIGAKATVLCGTTIESGVVVGAGAVVTHNVEKNCVIAGVPAKKIKDRIVD